MLSFFTGIRFWPTAKDYSPWFSMKLKILLVLLLLNCGLYIVRFFNQVLFCTCNYSLVKFASFCSSCDTFPLFVEVNFFSFWPKAMN